MKKSLALLLSLLIVFAILVPAFAAQDPGAVASAYVEQLQGSQNRLYITITVGGETVVSESFMIPNNAKGEYTLGGYRVYVATSGNTKIDACYIMPQQVQYLVTFYALDGTTFVCSQMVPDGGLIDGGNWDLYNSWSSDDALYENYQVTGNLQILSGWLKDLDTGLAFPWKETPITKNTNVTLAQDPQYDPPPSPVTPGELIVERPTLINLGFEWYVDGDDNGNAIVEVFYRIVGTDDWKQGMNLQRTPHTQHSQRSYPFTLPNMFAGSILDLQEDTEYECKFVMSDPDGVLGNDTEIVTARTRPEPKPAATEAEGGEGKVYHVYPREWTGPKETPNYPNLMGAYFENWANGDWSRFCFPRVKAGDTILVHAGYYKDNRHFYSSDIRGVGMGTPWDGTYYLTAKGTPEKPIAIKAAGDGEVVFDGDDNYNLFNVLEADYNYFEGFTIVNTDIAFLAGIYKHDGTVGLTVKNCYFDNIGIGVEGTYAGCQDFYIADNTFLGRQDHTKLIGWNNALWGFRVTGYPDDLYSYYAAKLYGSGHVMCHNYVSYFHDGLDLTTAMPDGYPGETERDKMCVANDIYNNFITVMTDNPIETDGSQYNVRVMRNLCLNAGEAWISMQPIFGGPIYWIRNIFYHQPADMATVRTGTAGGLKFSDPVGGILYNNLIGCEFFGTASTNIHFRNNLILSENPEGQLFGLTSRSNVSSSDYNAFYPAANPEGNRSFTWTSPDFTNKSVENNAARITRYFATLAEYSRATGQDTHSVLIDWDTFVGAPMPDRNDIGRIYTIDELNFELKPDSPAVDAGMFIPNVTEDYEGAAPDIGPYELGQPLPVYGPRS